MPPSTPPPDDDAVRREVEARVAAEGLDVVVIELAVGMTRLSGALIQQRRDGSWVARAARFDWKAAATAFGICVTPILVAYVGTH